MESRFRVKSEEEALLVNVLNEVLHGFSVTDFEKVIGVSKVELGILLNQLRMLDEDRELTLGYLQVKVFHNALKETLRELGADEFQTRTGYDYNEGKSILERLKTFLCGQIGDRRN